MQPVAQQANNILDSLEHPNAERRRRKFAFSELDDPSVVTFINVHLASQPDRRGPNVAAPPPAKKRHFAMTGTARLRKRPVSTDVGRDQAAASWVEDR